VEAERLGLVRMLRENGGGRDPGRMAAALRALSEQPRPSEVTVPGLLDGLGVIRARFAVLGRQAKLPLSEAAE